MVDLDVVHIIALKDNKIFDLTLELNKLKNEQLEEKENERN